jgi:hypothetical protein
VKAILSVVSVARSKLPLFVVCATLLGATLLGTPGSARADEGWSLSSLNPFKSKSRTGGGIQTRVTDQPESGLSKLSMPKMPKFDGTGAGGASATPRHSSLPSFSNRSLTKPPQPSMWSKFSSGSKNFFSRAKATMTSPFQKKQPSPFASPITGSRTHKASADKAKGTKSFFSSWLASPEPEPQPPRTVSEFLKQPKVQR